MRSFILAYSLLAVNAFQVHENLLSPHEVQELLTNANDGSVQLPSDILHRIQNAAVTNDSSSSCQANIEVTVQYQTITGTTEVHQDHDGSGRVVHEDVGFIFLNSEPGSYFQHGQHTLPASAGTFVQFRGDVPHHTVVQHGAVVNLAGPFDLSKYQRVGVNVTVSDSPSDSPSDAPSDTPSDSPSDAPSDAPSDVPSDAPSDAPSDTPSDAPSDAPSDVPSDVPSDSPSDSPSDIPTGSPTNAPVIKAAETQTLAPAVDRSERGKKSGKKRKTKARRKRKGDLRL